MTRPALCLGVLLLVAAPAVADPITFSNSGVITIPDNTQANPYPSTISVSGVTNPTGLTVTLSGLSHTWPSDLDILLVSPAGGTVMLLSDAGVSSAITGITLTFQDGLSAVPTPIVSGSYGPTNVNFGDVFPTPAPGEPYGNSLSALLGGNVNGTWSLFIVDDNVGDSGSLSGGWSLTFDVPAGIDAIHHPEPATLAVFASLVGVGGMVARRRKHVRG